MKLDHVALVVKNPRESADWYVKNLSATIEYIDDTWAMLRVGDNKIALTIKSQHPPHIAFSMLDLPEDRKAYKTHRDGSHYLYISDPDGNIIELIHYPEGG